MRGARSRKRLIRFQDYCLLPPRGNQSLTLQPSIIWMDKLDIEREGTVRDGSDNDCQSSVSFPDTFKRRTFGRSSCPVFMKNVGGGTAEEEEIGRRSVRHFQDGNFPSSAVGV